MLIIIVYISKKFSYIPYYVVKQAFIFLSNIYNINLNNLIIMNFKEISIYTLIPEIYKIINANNIAFSNYLDTFYDASVNATKVPVITSGNIKGAKGEFTTLVADNLIIKKQYSNLYENVTTSNYDWYNTYISGYTVLRDASRWEVVGYNYVDVDKPYYKIRSNADIAPRCANLSQIAEFIIDASTSAVCSILLDPSGHVLTIDSGSNGENVELICVAYDVSYGSTWVVKNTSGKALKSWTTEVVSYVP